MKIYMVHEDPWHAGNPYIYTLIEELNRQHPEDLVSWGREIFWSNEIFSYDIVHFHWPQAFMNGDCHSEKDLLEHILSMHKEGVKIVSTCHDLAPHYNQCSDYARSMKYVYDNSDAIFHLGEYSKKLFEKEYPNSNHYMLPHHLYDTIYRIFPSRRVSSMRLGLSEKKNYILCFGTFRSDEERNLVINLCKQLNSRCWKVLAPGFMDVNYPRKSLRGIKQRLQKQYIKYRYGIYCTGKTFDAVSDEAVPYYYGVADVALIHRVKILNSGNAFMPMLFSKVVVGPDMGNVGAILKRWGYPVFETNDLSTLGRKILYAYQLSKQNMPQLHHNQQMAEYSTSKITKDLYNYYRKIM